MLGMIPFGFLMAGTVLPTGTMLQDGGTVQLLGSLGSTGSNFCAFNDGNGSPGTSCSASFLSNQGSANGTATGYTDQNGLHVVASASSGGQTGGASVDAVAVYSDTLSDPFFFTMSFSAQFDLHAVLATVNDSLSQYTLTYKESGACNDTQTWYGSSRGGAAYTDNYGNSVNLVVNTATCQIPSATDLTWSVTLKAVAITDILQANGCDACGSPEALVDAGNTLSFTGFTLTSPWGDALDGSAVAATGRTLNGVDYSVVAQSDAPEPATWCLLLAGAGAIGIRRFSSGR